MIDPAYHQSQSPFDFRFARLEALRAAVDELLRQRPRQAVTNGVGQVGLHIHSRIDRGLQSVPIYKIIGAEGRFARFESRLAPGDQSAHLLRQTQRPASVSPIKLYKVEESYFVQDGNERVAAARARGQLFLPGQVVEYVIDSSFHETSNAINLLLVDERNTLFETTGLASHKIECSVLGNYPLLMQHIDMHCQDLQSQQERIVKRETAAANWFEMVYQPIINVARRQNIMGYFPEYTEADLYLWATEHRWDVYQSLNNVETIDVASLRDRLKVALRAIISLGRAIRAEEQSRKLSHTAARR